MYLCAIALWLHTHTYHFHSLPPPPPHTHTHTHTGLMVTSAFLYHTVHFNIIIEICNVCVFLARPSLLLPHDHCHIPSHKRAEGEDHMISNQLLIEHTVCAILTPEHYIERHVLHHISVKRLHNLMIANCEFF